MSLFLDFKIASRARKTTSTVAIQWCKIDQIVAIAGTDNSINFYQEEGELLEESDLIRNCKPCCLDWRPTSKVLASGWEDGSISLWNLKDRSEKDDHSIHSHPISVMQWSPEGGRLLVGDTHGLVSIWKTDHRSRLAIDSKYQVISDEGYVEPITCSTWMITSEYRDAQSDLPTPPQYFIVATARGSVLVLDLKGQVMANVKETSPISKMLWYEEKQRLVLISSDCVLTQYDINLTQRNQVLLSLVSRVKLSMTATAVKAGISSAVWVAPGLLATCAPEHMVRFWDLEHDENYMVSISSMHDQDVVQKKDYATTLAFNSRKKLLSLGTRNGKTLIWRFVGDSGSIKTDSQHEDSNEVILSATGELKMDDVYGESKNGGKVVAAFGQPTRPPSTNQDWQGINDIQGMNEPIEFLEWGPGEAVFVVATDYASSIFNQAVLHRRLRNDVAAVQVSSQRVLIRRGGSTQIDHEVGIRIKGLDVNENHLVVWNKKKAEIYEFSNGAMHILSSFPTKAESIALHAQSIFQTVGNKLEICNLQGVSTKTIVFSEQEGQPRLLDVAGKHLALATTRGVIQLFDVSRREPKPIGSGKRFTLPNSKKLLGEIRSIKCNADGTRVSILCDRARGAFLCEPDTKLHVWYPEKDVINQYDFGPIRYPISHFWDAHEPRLLACEAMKTGRTMQQMDTKMMTPADAVKEAKSLSEIQLYTLFATDEFDKGIMMQDSFPLDKGLEALLGLRVPRLFFTTKPLEENNGLPKLKGRTMRDFVGLDSKLDEETKKALINFSYYLAISNMDEAYRAVKLIQNIAVWENMAHMCVKTKRLDVAEVCLGNMGHARGAAALRAAKQEPELEAQVAMVAIQLGLLEDAERLYLECGRYDLLNKMLQASGQWEKALEVANQYDRVHLRETHFKYAKYLESLRDHTAAIKNFEASDTHCTQVPRMLFEANKLDELDAYIQSAGDEKLTCWWGQYCESLGEFDRAVHVYSQSNDDLSLVRLYSYLDNMQAAEDVALNSDTPAASYFLARHCEQKGDIKQAIQFFSRAGRYNHAVRLAKEHGYDNEIVNLALRASQPIMVEAAKYLEARNINESAVLLYQKGGNVPRALDLCFRAQLFDQLRNIADSLNDESNPEAQSSPEILSRCAEFFIEHKQYEKAVHLLITGTDYERALELCMNHKVVITEDMAERMTLSKMSGKSSGKGKAATNPAKAAENDRRRQELLLQLAKCCKKQGSYHLATKKYTQAGDKLKAMKCLLKSGDTDKIIFFAGVSKRPEIYILAANYLQNLDWHNNPDTMKHIITFYTKAKAFHQLSNFYDACAQVEIDEYRDYDKALGALKEAAKYLKKASIEGKDNALDSLNQRISLVERFVHARACSKSDPREAEKICQSLLSHPEVETAIRTGDVFALLLDYYYEQRDMVQAYQLLERMKTRGIAMGPYLDQEVVAAVYRSQNIEYDVNDGKGVEDDDDIEEEIEWGGDHK